MKSFDQLPELPRRELRDLRHYFRAEVRRLLRGGTSLPAVVYRPTEPMVVHTAEYVPQAMSLPPCLCMPDSQAGIERRFLHARGGL